MSDVECYLFMVLFQNHVKERVQSSHFSLPISIRLPPLFPSESGMSIGQPRVVLDARRLAGGKGISQAESVSHTSEVLHRILGTDMGKMFNILFA